MRVGHGVGLCAGPLGLEGLGLGRVEKECVVSMDNAAAKHFRMARPAVKYSCLSPVCLNTDWPLSGKLFFINVPLTHSTAVLSTQVKHQTSYILGLDTVAVYY